MSSAGRDTATTPARRSPPRTPRRPDATARAPRSTADTRPRVTARLRLPRRIAGVGLLLAALGCARAEPEGHALPDPGPPVPDTLVGRVAVVGSEPLSFVVLRTDDAQLRLTGDEVPLLRRVAGADVWIEGVPDREQGPLAGFDVRRFEVRAVDGVPAADGILLHENGRFFLFLQSGARRPVTNPPVALRQHLGARVWVAGPPGSEPAAFGLIRPAGR